MSAKYQCTGDWEQMHANANLFFAFEIMCTLAQTNPDSCILRNIHMSLKCFSLHWNPDSSIQLPVWHLLLDVCHLEPNLIWFSPPDPEPAPTTLSLISGDDVSGFYLLRYKPGGHYWSLSFSHMLYESLIWNGPLPSSPTTLSPSPCPSHAGLFAVIQIPQVHSYPRAFPLLFPQPDP